METRSLWASVITAARWGIMLQTTMYYGKPETSDDIVVYSQVALPFKPEDAEEI